ncbi:MAG: sodium:calcium antiporter [Candidatus Staskawiczbacteria bacterium]|nr:sodium:calcium antiporter [Candidatus Staskawiczbacteria bacterium]
MVFQIIIFIVACFVLSWLSKSLVKTLVEVAKYLRWREFVVGFFVMAFATSLPNLFVDINAALHGFPELAFGDVLGGNLVDLTLVMALAVLFSKKGIPAKSKMVQTTAFFTAIIAVLPLLLIMDKNLSRIDGVILILAFFMYVIWLFSKGDNFEKVYKSNKKEKNVMDAFWFLKNSGKLLFLLILLVVSSFIVINTAQFFASAMGASLALVGVLIVGLGNSFPEAYFSVIAARKGEGWMILGDLMGSVIVCATLVLGIVALITPFQITDFSPFLIARAFTLLAVVLYVFAIRTDKKITKKEGLILLLMYILFLIAEIFIK